MVLILTILFSISGRGEEVDRWLKYRGGGGVSVLMDPSCDLLTNSSLSVFTPSESSQAAERGRTVYQRCSHTRTEHTHIFRQAIKDDKTGRKC